MEGKKLTMFLLLVVALELLLFSATEAKPWWWRRRSTPSPPRPPPCDSSTPSGVQWVNNWHKHFSHKCGNGYSLKHWHSLHRNCKEDRIHYFQCGYAPVLYNERNCAPTNYQNDYDVTLNFKCPHNGFITGVKSVYDNRYKDRRFAFRCCHVPGYIQHSCKHTQYLNNWDQPVNYRVPYGYYMVGVYSYHDNNHEDRLWGFEICKITKSQGK